jgi:hypothetical protein
MTRKCLTTLASQDEQVIKTHKTSSAVTLRTTEGGETMAKKAKKAKKARKAGKAKRKTAKKR